MAYKLFSKEALAKLLVTAVVASSGVGYGSVAFAATPSTSINTLTDENTALSKLSQDLTALQNQLRTDGTLSLVTQAQTNAQNYGWAAAMPGASSKLVNALASLISLCTLGGLAGDSSTTSGNVQQIKSAFATLDPSLTGSVVYGLYTNFKTAVELQALMNIQNGSPASTIDYDTQMVQALQTAIINTPVVASVIQANGITNLNAISSIANTALSSIDQHQAAANAIATAMVQTHAVLTGPLNPVTLTTGQTTQTLPGIVLHNLPPSLSSLEGQLLPSVDYAYTVTPNIATATRTNTGWTLTGTASGNATVNLYLAGTLVASTTLTLTVPDPAATQTVTQITSSPTTHTLATITVPPIGAPTIPPQTIQGTSLTANLSVPAGALQPGETIGLTSNVDTSTLQQVINKTIPANQAPKLVFGVSFSGAAPSQPITLTIGGGTGQDAIPDNAVVYKLTDAGEVPMPSSAYSVHNGVLAITFSTDPYFIVAVPQGNSGGNGPTTTPPAQLADATNSTVNLSATSIQTGQSITVSGVVKDASSKVVANRTVQVQFDNKTGVTVTGADGSYSVTLTPDKPITNGPVTVKVDASVISNASDVATVTEATPAPVGPTIAQLTGATFSLGTFKVDAKGATFTKTVGTTSVTVNVPAGAFAKTENVGVIGSVDPSVLAFALNPYLPSGSQPEEAFGLLYSGAAPTQPITITVSNAAITAGATVFNISTGGSNQVGSAQSGSVTVSATDNPYFLVVQVPQQPVVTQPKQGPGPQSFTTSTVTVNGKKVASTPTFVANKTTYMSISYVNQTLKSLGFTVKWDGKTKTWTLTAPKSAKVNLSKITLNKGDVSIKLNGKVVYHAPEIVATDPNTNNDTTFLPIWYVMQTLQRAGIQSTWNGSTWKLTKH